MSLFGHRVGSILADTPPVGAAPRLVTTPGVFQGSQSNATVNIPIAPTTAGSSLFMAWLKTSQTGNVVNSVSDNVQGSSGWAQFSTPFIIVGGTPAEGVVWQAQNRLDGITQISVNVSASFGWSVFWGIETTEGQVGQRTGNFNSYTTSHNIASPGLTEVDGFHFATTWTYTPDRVWTAQDGWTLVGAAGDRNMAQYKEAPLTADVGGPALTNGSTDTRFFTFTVVP